MRIKSINQDEREGLEDIKQFRRDKILYSCLYEETSQIEKETIILFSEDDVCNFRDRIKKEELILCKDSRLKLGLDMFEKDGVENNGHIKLYRNKDSIDWIVRVIYRPELEWHGKW